MTGHTFYIVDGGGQNTLMLNYSNSDEAQIEEGIKRLACAMDELLKEARSETIVVKRKVRHL